MKCPIDVEKKVAEMRQELHPDALVEDAYRAILGAMNGAYFGISFREACLRLNEDFHLGLSDNKPSRAEISARLQAREKEDAKKEADSAAYYQVVEEHRRLLALKKALAPNRDAADYIHPLYAEAVKRLPYLEWWLEENIEMGR
ncbi:hypothetical protein RLF98_23030 [Flavonifractor plautii]|uniref:hypothetical protein n=1 Tax=Flavonifractor plautii TaxID=292800 RepID=UPI00287DEA03|nr:hypothetical protein [Flavonifractor plautii]MDS9669065.1 hypothetical protein [Flavonifractor plautii]MDS9669347.1 hypothetical protein [Flavonifractor plautii]